MSVYELPDEPRPSRLSTLAVNPAWPLFSFMFGGSWIAFVWFTLNGFAIGSPRRKRDAAVVALALVGAVAITFWLASFAHVKLLGGTSLRFGLLALTLWKLAFAYMLFMSQQRSFALYEYYGGSVRNGLFVVVAAFALATRLQGRVPPFWRIVLM
jgi:hypothetical protein